MLIFITPPKGIKAKDLDIKITKNHLKVGLKGVEKPFLDEDLCDTVIEEDSFWTMDDGVVGKLPVAQSWQAQRTHSNFVLL